MNSARVESLIPVWLSNSLVILETSDRLSSFLSDIFKLREKMVFKIPIGKKLYFVHLDGGACKNNMGKLFLQKVYLSFTQTSLPML